MSGFIQKLISLLIKIIDEFEKLLFKTRSLLRGEHRKLTIIGISIIIPALILQFFLAAYAIYRVQHSSILHVKEGALIFAIAIALPPLAAYAWSITVEGLINIPGRRSKNSRKISAKKSD